MNKRISLGITLLSLSLLSSVALADNIGQDAESDMIMGHGMVTAHKGEPATPGPKGQQGTQDDLMYSGKPYQASKGSPPLPGADQDNHDNNTSLLHM
jgi:hypothetical protein